MKCVITPRRDMGPGREDKGAGLRLTAETDEERTALLQYIEQMQGRFTNMRAFGNMTVVLVDAATIEIESP